MTGTRGSAYTLMNKFTVYLIKTKKEYHWYIGATQYFEHRISNHKKGNGSKFTAVHGVSEVEVLEITDSLNQAKNSELKWLKLLRKQNPGFHIKGAGDTSVCCNPRREEL